MEIIIILLALIVFILLMKWLFWPLLETIVVLLVYILSLGTVKPVRGRWAPDTGGWEIARRKDRAHEPKRWPATIEEQRAEAARRRKEEEAASIDEK